MSPAAIAAERAAVVAEALTWEGTAFHHAARLKGAGVDCCQLVLAVYVGLALIDEPVVEPYPAQWFLHHDRERILEIVQEIAVRTAHPAPGDLALFRFGRAVSHAGLIVETTPELVMVHSFLQRGVRRESLGPHSTGNARLDSFWTLTRWADGRAD